MTLGTGDSGRKEAGVFWLFVSLDGRISREPFWLGLIFINLVMLIVFNILQLNGVTLAPDTFELVGLRQNQALALILVLFWSTWSMIALFAKRAHDYGVTGFVAALALVPVLGYILVLFLGVVPGTPGPNAFGRRTNAPSQSS